ncbi:MAG: hypothetical protein ACJ760_10400 [Thermoleophilaceae bacterium]
MRRVLLFVIAAAATAVPVLTAAADSVDGRLDGEFAMKGKITRAVRVKGEHEGDKVARTWLFTSKCDSGPCDEVILHRHRGKKRVDRVVLDRKGPGEYAGKNKFHFPIRCAGRVYEHGGEARATISVKVTEVDADGVATKVTAKYDNPRRINHTQCGDDKDLGKDAARYTGHLRDSGGGGGGSDSGGGGGGGTGTGGVTPP